MLALRQIVPGRRVATAVLAGALAVSAVSAVTAAYAQGSAAPAADDGSSAPGWRHGMHGDHAFSPMGRLLHQLNLTPDQQAQIKSIMAGQRSQFEALRASAKANRRALAITAPSDPSYPGLVQTAQTNAATRIAMMSGTWKQIYESVLTKAQRDQIPALVAAAEQARESRMEHWKAEHSPAQ